MSARDEGDGLTAGAEETDEARRVVYCLIPPELAERLHEPLRRHFRDDPGVEVVVEQRRAERRSREDRRRAAGKRKRGAERRAVRGALGRRVGERRAAVAPVEPPPLPRRARRYAEQLVFFERREPSTQQLEDLDTARVVMRVQAGDSEAFAKIYSRFFDRVFGYMRVALADFHEAEDATQQVFVQVLEKLPGYERRSRPFRAWLFTVVRNEALMNLRRRGRLEPVDPHELEAAAAKQGAEDEGMQILDWITDRDLAMFVERLPVVQRQVLLLRYTLDMTDVQIAAQLGRSREDVRQLQHRAIDFLRKRLAAIGRGPRDRKPAPIRRVDDQAVVLRARRWSLYM